MTNFFMINEKKLKKSFDSNNDNFVAKNAMCIKE